MENDMPRTIAGRVVLLVQVVSVTGCASTRILNSVM